MGITKSKPVPLTEFVAWRKAAGLTQPDIARLMEVTVSTVSGWESGKLPIPTQKAVKLSLTSGVPLDKMISDARSLRILNLLSRQVGPPSSDTEEKADVA